MLNWTNERRRLGDLVPWLRNPRHIGEDEARRLNEGLDEFAQVETIAIGPANEIYNGHQRLKVWMGAHGPNYEVDVRVSSRPLTEKEREKLTILLHKGAVGDWDAAILAQEFNPADLAQWGFAEGELEEMLRAAGIEPIGDLLNEPGDAEPQLDRAEELAAEWGTSLGQLWRLPSRVEGQYHLLACGDCTDAAVVERLMGGERAALFATDPPYLVDYDGTNHPQKWNSTDKKTNKDWSSSYKDWDAAEQGEALYDGFIAVAIEHAITENAAWYCWHASRRQAMLEAVWERHGAFVHQQIIWFKDRPVLTRSFYMWQHEPCFFGWVRGKKPARTVDEWLSSVWEFPTQTAFEKTDHPTQKPLALFEIPMRQHTRPGELVYEPFSGSGTQIVAAENLGRQCRAVEIAPQFAAVALDRYLRAFEIRGELVEL